jgi:hypothetical protein
MLSRFLNILAFFCIMIIFVVLFGPDGHCFLFFLTTYLPLQVKAPLIALLAKAIGVVLPVRVLTAYLRLHSLSLADWLAFPRCLVRVIFLVDALCVV